MSDELILVERPRAGLACITLNRPGAMNALSNALRTAIVTTLKTLSEDGVHVIVLTGAGRAFCAGLDLKEMSSDTSGLGSLDSNNPIAAIEHFPGVVIGAINGAAVTGGFELALACDILIAGEAARFADTHARVGVMPGWGLSQKLSRIIGIVRAKTVSLSGRYISAAQAENWGLVAQTVPQDQLLETAITLAGEILASPPEMVLSLKKVIDDGYAMSFTDGIALEKARAAAHNAAMTPDDIAGRRAAVQSHGKTQTGAMS